MSDKAQPYDIAYENGDVRRRDLTPAQLQHFERAVDHPNARVVSVEPATDDLEEATR